jgi:hypothetical protein
MRRVVLLSVALFGASAFVAAGPPAGEPDPKLLQPPDPVLPVTAEAVGIVVDKAQGGYKFVDLTKDLVFGRRLQLSVPVNTTIFTRQPVKLRIHHGDDVREVLFGPNPGSDDFASMQIKNTATCIYLMSGYVLLDSDWPTVKTERVEAAAEGCEWMVQVDTAADLHRVYFISGTKASATIKGMPPQETQQTNTFFEVRPDLTTDGWMSLDTRADLQAFVQEAVQKAAAAGIAP